MKRREFLRASGWFVVGASLPGLPGCGDDARPRAEPAGTYAFPQGLASADPDPTSVVLWTRVVRGRAPGPAPGPIELVVQVAADAAFLAVVAERTVTATAASDHTVRVLVTGLCAGTAYHYRFTAGRDSITGRTRTAPDPAADVQVNLAWVSCQDYVTGHYGAYRQMIVDDDARPAADRIHLVIHLGDAIYETRGDQLQTALADDFTPLQLANRDGSPRAVAPFPSGGGARAGLDFARTADDYRHLYRTYLTDPDVRAARARWPFVHVWDDHEFSDDAWQSQANYDGAQTLDEPDQARRVAASQAWSEYIPARLTGAGGVPGVPPAAADFAPVAVEDAPFTPPSPDNFVEEPNNAAAVGAITIYRSLRLGRHVELVLTDERSYRSDHAIPEQLTAGNPLFFVPRNALPLLAVNVFDRGHTAGGGHPPATVLGLPNLRAESPVGTLLGARQKAWWKATLAASDATWKLWANPVALTRLRLQAVPTMPIDRVVSGDSWDGYPTERAELLTFLRDAGIRNVVALTGDLHAGFAGVLVDDFDAAAPAPVACELVGPPISSNSLFALFEYESRALPAALRGLITVDATAAGGDRFTETLNLWLLHGTAAAASYAATLDLAQSLAAADPAVNPHLRYADTNAQGYGYARVTAAAVEATIVTIERPVAPPSDRGPGVKRTATFTIPANDPGGMTGPVLTGKPPFPLT